MIIYAYSLCEAYCHILMKEIKNINSWVLSLIIRIQLILTRDLSVQVRCRVVNSTWNCQVQIAIDLFLSKLSTEFLLNPYINLDDKVDRIG